MPDLSPAFTTQPPDQPAARTGTCPVCGRENLPLHAGLVQGHPELCINRSSIHDGAPCDGAGQPPEADSETRPTQTKPYRGNAMAAGRRNDIAGRGDAV